MRQRSGSGKSHAGCDVVATAAVVGSGRLWMVSMATLLSLETLRRLDAIRKGQLDPGCSPTRKRNPGRRAK